MFQSLSKIIVTSFFLFLVILGFYLNQTKPLNYLSENLFLTFHQNESAIKILESLPKGRKDFYTYFLLGRIYFVEGNLSKSIENYNKSIKLNPKHKESYYGLGLSYGFLGNVFLEDAEESFEKYIELDKEEFQRTGHHAYGAWAGYNDLAWVHFLKGEFQEAEKVSRQASEFSSENPWLLNMLAISLIEQDKCIEAYPIIQQAKNLADNITTEQFGQAYSGDNKKWWSSGLEQMKKTIQENVLICANVK